MSQPSFHPFYRIWFTWIDPLSLVLTATTCFRTPAVILEKIVPSAISPYMPAQAAIIHQTSILYAFMGSMMAVLLRASTDPKVWEIVQAATLAVDIALLATMIVSLRQQERLAWSKWRGVEVKNLVFLGMVSGIRTAFLLGVGV